MGENVKRTTDLCVKEPATATTFFLKLFQIDRQTGRKEDMHAEKRAVSSRKKCLPFLHKNVTTIMADMKHERYRVQKNLHSL